MYSFHFMKKKIALITGITGQDGAYLAEFLIKKNYIVHGIKRRASTTNNFRIDELYNNYYEKPKKSLFFLHYGDVTDSLNLTNIISRVKPDEIYNLAAQSHVKISFEIPDYTSQVDALGTLRILESMRELQIDSKFYQASTSELFGKVQETPQNEKTPFYPRSPYGVAKLYSYWIIKNYREAYNLFACNGILFNHESPRRGGNFVTKKITAAVAEINRGNLDCLTLGNLNAKRDWGYAPEYVEGMWMILQESNADDYVFATGRTSSIRAFVELSFKYIDIDIAWKGEGINEIGINSANNKVLVRVDPNYFRPTEVDTLVGDASKAKKKLGWEAKTTLEELVNIMMKNELK